MPPPSLSATVVAKAKQMLGDGKTVREVSAKLGIATGSVSKILAKMREGGEKANQPVFHKMDPKVEQSIRDMILDGITQGKIAKVFGITQQSVSDMNARMIQESRATLDTSPVKSTTFPPSKAEPEEIKFPDAVEESHEPFKIDREGTWLILNDVHLPYHDRTTIELAVATAKKRNLVGILLNGDILDSHEVSRFDKDPRAPRYKAEIETGKQFFAWLRGQCPSVDVIYKAGNHEDRLDNYIIQRAPALFDLEGVNLEALLHLKEFGIEWVADKRVIELGKLNVVHGHEFPGGCTSPVNPARGLYMRAKSVALCGHHHRTSEHHEKNIRGQAEAAWSIGCACHLNPRYFPINNFNHGFGIVSVESGGLFSVENKRVLGGKVV
jgi:hypothetical protein